MGSFLIWQDSRNDPTGNGRRVRAKKNDVADFVHVVWIRRFVGFKKGKARRSAGRFGAPGSIREVVVGPPGFEPGTDRL
jgi:hypothetical protein